MGFHGNLRTMHLGDVFQNISQNRMNGNLRIFTKELGDVDLFFMEGELTLYHSKNLEDIQWSRVFLAKGILTEEEVGVIESQGIRGEEELAGIISSQIIGEDKAAVCFQHIIEEEIYELFTMSDCEFSFESATEVPTLYTYTELFKRTLFNTNMILMEAARRSDENSQEGNISSHEIFIQTQDKDKAAHSNLTEEEWRIFDLVDGYRNVSEVVRDSGNKRQAVVKVLKHLLELKIIKISETKDLLSKASHLSSVQDYDSAAKIYRHLVDMEKAVLSHRELLAETFLKLQQKDNAIMQLEIMSNEYIQRKDFKKASEGLLQILEIDPTRFSVRETIANNYIEMGKKKDAVAELKSVLQSYIDSGVFEKAKLICTKLLAIEPEDLKVMDLMAKTCVSRGDRAQAVEVWTRMSEIYFNKELYDDASEILKRILKVEPSNDRAKEMLNAISVKQGKAKTRQVAVIVTGSIIIILILIASGLFYIEQRVKNSLEVLKIANDVLLVEVKNSQKLKDVEEKTEMIVKSYSKFKEDHPYSITYFDINNLIYEANSLKDRKKDEFNKLSIEQTRQLEDDFSIVMEASDKKSVVEALKDLEAYKAKIKDDAKLVERLGQVDSKILLLKNLEKEGLQKLASISENVKVGKIDQANLIAKDLLANYDRVNLVDKIQFHVTVSSSEPDSKLLINGELINKSLPIVHAYKPGDTIKFVIQKDGYYDFQEEVSEGKKPSISATLKRKILWKYNLQNPMSANIIYKDSALFLFSRNGRIVSLGLEFATDSYKELWAYKMGLPSSDIFAAGTIDNDISFVGSSDRHLYCLDIAAGREYWKKKLTGPVNSAVAVSKISLRQDQKMVFAACAESADEGLVFGLDAKSGNVEWQKKIRGRAFSDVLANSAKVYIGTDQNKIVVLRASTGQSIEVEGKDNQMVALEYKSFGQFKNSMVLREIDGNEYLMASCVDQNIYCYDEKTGNKIWNFQTNSPNNCGLTADENNIYNSAADGLITSIKIAESARSSKPILNWSLRFDGFKEPTQVCIADNILYVGGTSDGKLGKLIAIRKNDGKLLWTLDTPACINSRPLAAEGRVFVGCDDNQVYVLKEIK